MTEYTLPSEGIVSLPAHVLAQKIQSGELTSREVTQAFLDRIAETDNELGAFLHVGAEEALAAADEVDAQVAAGKPPASKLAGVPLALKDLLVTTDAPTTAASKMLEGYRSPYDATVVRKLREAGIPILGKTNLDEFAMGSSTENSAYQVTRNPHDLERVPGGSGGGTAAALASGQAPIGIGTDTGGSIRQPASLTGTVGVKPTYGGVSRYGVIACASSLDQVGPCANNVLDTALLHEIIGGHDEFDATSVDTPVQELAAAAEQGASGDLSGVKIGRVKQFSRPGTQPGVTERIDAAFAQFERQGAEIVEVDCPSFDDVMGAYYIIQMSEVSSNLARFDGMRYGLRTGDDGKHSAEDVMASSRGDGFGPEVKRRIILGTYALSVGYYDAYYLQAQRVRTLIAQDFRRAFEKVDVIAGPAVPQTAFKIGEKVDDPLAMYNFDLFTLPLNLAGLPGMSVPAGTASDTGLPVGLQIIAPAFEDERLYRVGAAFEAGR
ncbi:MULTISPECIES: Asp-tRNA(Asn)/Glu-tRNA(Gln) amidotransferase subunit GatA [Corynebacterium]|uniref:Asp-tRNA(Asn)/Glu-tRNA(Gln) amidotransferase subunit GatA n=1 Tax=Corynebacterium TaxID=1716 RepID=UPI002108A4C9|nr:MULTISPECIES: Asp-tRNA(Asn)/Glu-tRNA(Gln) amidotransferase subunit GatA [Corynebacterium]MCQ4610092.1 Asp-tRNA(Asn)/Glu-tRNA(Gln) amidotransferase subunit GatA [Corynebacterium sp. CCUG 61414]MCQ4617220.1 Asp-tRNA(Asn)/Glu-tRNA(Gln) amidotransferase subunit GatA [Corynebacterium pseudogenitalium]MDK8244192.1 Asp-tRNA(Asn)/Glu-tRNA(Gln) amidotransferase subunit GatA [Corynebacterium sp. UMB10321]UUA88218.1 Asp-tRNA(Asn)/Glu-tRNA(Gln) amidotransferase subunit GatA [Corynebacterium pseudogenita